MLHHPNRCQYLCRDQTQRRRDHSYCTRPRWFSAIHERFHALCIWSTFSDLNTYVEDGGGTTKRAHILHCSWLPLEICDVLRAEIETPSFQALSSRTSKFAVAPCPTQFLFDAVQAAEVAIVPSVELCSGSHPRYNGTIVGVTSR